MSTRRQSRILAGLLGALARALAGCGQMGPLVLPGEAGDQGETGADAAGGNAAAAGSGDEAEDSSDGGENEQ